MRYLARFACLLPVCLGLASPEARGDDLQRSFRVVEKAGLRRFGYPVHATLPRELVGPNFRLLRDGKAVPAQFRTVEVAGAPGSVALDFNTSIGPLESQEYVVESGKTVSPGPEPRSGLTVEVKGGIFRVANGSSLSYDIPETLEGVFRSVKNVRLEFWRPGGRGLVLGTTTGGTVRLGEGSPLTARVTRSGPIAIGLRFEGVATPKEGKPIPAVVGMTFPNSKSWGEIRWTVDDTEGVVRSLTADLGLKIDLEPAIVDLGAHDTVYGFLRGKERMTLESEPGGGWLICKGPPEALSAFARSTPLQINAPVEGWAHVMDALRCTAAAVDQFGKVPGTRDAIEVDATGSLLLRRTFEGETVPRGPKTLQFWLHFVNNPVQIGAVTSPQAMQAPLLVDWGTP